MTITTSSGTQVLVLGAGPGGYAAAFMAADLGFAVTLVDEEKTPGGVCLFRGCIPSKALLHASKLISDSREAAGIGIDFGKPVIDLKKIREWKDRVVQKLAAGLGQLCARRTIRYIQGHGRFLDSARLEVKRAGGAEEIVSFDHAIVASGSEPVTLPVAPVSPRVLDSTSALNLEDIPGQLLIVGGGYIGLEMATAYCELGAEVSLVEMAPSLLPGTDPDLTDVLHARLVRRFKSIMLNTRVTKVEEQGGGLRATLQGQDGKISTQHFDKMLVAIGRTPHSKGLGLENTDAELTPDGFLRVDPQRATTDPRIHAIGDVAGEPMLAHKATHEGRLAAISLSGGKAAFEPRAIPSVIFTNPEIAWCGVTESEARKRNIRFTIAKFPWAASGRAATINRMDGFTKLGSVYDFVSCPA